MLLGWWLFRQGAIYWLLPVLFLMGAQSAFFSPAKYGFLPEALPVQHLPRGNGSTQLFTFLAIIFGGWAGGELSERFGGAPQNAAVFCVLVAVFGVAASYRIVRTPPGNRSTRCAVDPFTPHVRTILEMRRDPLLLTCFLGNTYFWFMGVLFQSNLAMMIKGEMAGTDRQVGFFQGAVALGIGLGSLACGFLLRGKLTTRYVLPAGVGMAVLAVLLGLSIGKVWQSLTVSALLGFSTGFYQLPLNTILQQRSPEHKRGRYLAAMNALDCVSMLMASVFHWLLLNSFQMPPSWIFIVSGAVTIVVILALAWSLPRRSSPNC